jgi:O-antigen/teichoic acid export membrane protein
LALCEIATALFAAAITVITAVEGLGAFSLVLGKIAGAVLTAGVFGVIGWRRWRPRLHFARRDLKGYLSFGLYQMGQSTLVFLTGQIDQLYVGIVLGPVSLGYYAFAWNLVLQPMMKLNYVLTRVAFPLFAKVQFDGERLQRGYLNLLWLLVSINAPILIGCAATAPLLVPIIFGSKWLPAVAIVQILAFACLFISMMNPVDSLMLAKGRTDLGFVWRFWLLFPELLGICAGGRVGGLIGVAFAKLLLNMVYWAAQYQFVVRAMIGPCLKLYLGSALPSLGIAGLMGAAIWWWPSTPDESPIVALASRVTVGIVIYVVLGLLLLRSRIYQMRELLLAK